MPANGQLVSHYEVVEQIGEGGMGVVYRAHDTRLDRDVALKFLSSSNGRSSEQIEAFLREARAISRLNHPNIATIYSVDEYEGQPFLAFEYLPGGTLRSHLDEIRAKGEFLPPEKTFRWAVHIGRALAHAHNHGIIHRDVKSENILLTAAGALKLTDFGVALMARDTAAGGRTETAGTPAYLSPEQALGLEVDYRTDMFSYGTVVFEMATGRLPFDAKQEAVLLFDIANTPAPRLAEFREGVYDEGQPLLDRLMAKHPDDRFATMDEALTALRRLDDGLRLTETKAIRGVNFDPTIAVLPFVDMSPAKDQEYFCDGITEEIINGLSGVKGLRVVSRGSSFQFKGEPYDIREIGKKLNVRSILEGSVRKAGDQLRIAVQHINVADGYHLWSQRFDREMADVFAIQDEIAAATVAHLRLELESGGREKTRQATQNLEAYNCYLQGRFYLNQRVPGALREALACFEHAAELDPDYALAFAGQAEAGLLLATRGHLEDDPRAAMEKARAAAREAIRLDSDCAEAHVALAMVVYRADWDFADAEAHYLRAIEINAGYATAYHQYAMLLATLNRSEEALEKIRIAQDRDPLSLIISTAHGRILHFARRFEEAIAQCKRTIDLDPNFVPAYFDLCVAYGQTGHLKEAKAVIESMEGLDPDELRNMVMMARYHALAGKPEEARRALDDIRRIAKERHVSPIIYSIVHMSLGETEAAMETLEAAVEQRDPMVVYMQCEPVYDAIREHPRYPALLRKIGFPA